MKHPRSLLAPRGWSAGRGGPSRLTCICTSSASAARSWAASPRSPSAAGHTVTGCDANVYPPMSTQLEALGIALTEGYDAAQLDGVARDADLFVVGNVIIARQSADGGDPRPRAAVHVRPAVAARATCCTDKWVLAVAGTHGKTTTSSMLAWILEHAGTRPGLPHRRRAARLRRLGAAHATARSS